jgi:hypothetical protein
MHTLIGAYTFTNDPGKSQRRVVLVEAIYVQVVNQYFFNYTCMFLQILYIKSLFVEEIGLEVLLGERTKDAMSVVKVCVLLKYAHCSRHVSLKYAHCSRQNMRGYIHNMYMCIYMYIYIYIYIYVVYIYI